MGKAFHPKALVGVVICAILLPCSSSNFYSGVGNERPFRVRTTRFVCLGAKSTEYIQIHECSLKLLRNGSSTVSFNATILQPLESVWGTAKIMYKGSSLAYQPMLGIDERADVCHFLGSEPLAGSANIGSVFYTALRKIVKKYAPQLARPCPIVGEYSIVNFTFHDHMFPPFLPAGDYRNDMRAFVNNNETLLEMQFYGSVRAKGIADLSMG